MILDDAVVHHADLQAVAIGQMRVSVVFGHATVGGPSGVGDPGEGRCAFGIRLGLKVCNTTYRTDPRKRMALVQGDACGVIAPVFEFA